MTIPFPCPGVENATVQKCSKWILSHAPLQREPKSQHITSVQHPHQSCCKETKDGDIKARQEATPVDT